MHLDIGWMCGGVAHSFHTAVKQLIWTQEMSPRVPNVRCSVAPWSVFAIGSALTYLQLFWKCATPLHIHPMFGTSLHVISFTRPSPVLVLQVTNARVRRPGYEATKQLRPWSGNHAWWHHRYCSDDNDVIMCSWPVVGHWDVNNTNDVLVWDNHNWLPRRLR